MTDKEKTRSRVAVLWFPDWPVYATGYALGWDPLRPAAVLDEHTVKACNEAARKEGVRTNMPLRHAQLLCPELLSAPEDCIAEAGIHEEIVHAMETVAASVETLRPGLLAFNLRALAAFYGDETAAMEQLLNAAARWQADCWSGTSDDVISAVWAARARKTIAEGHAAEFIAQLPITAMAVEPSLGRPYQLVHTLQQLGVKTMADFSAIDRADVATRFGQEALQWHRVASGQPQRDLAPVAIPAQQSIQHEVEEPITNTNTAAFIARRVAADLHQQLSDAGHACLRLAVRAHLQPPETYNGPLVIERIWRCQEPLTEAETAQRVRWQLEGWITRLAHDRSWQHPRSVEGAGGDRNIGQSTTQGIAEGIAEGIGEGISEVIDQGIVGITCLELTPLDVIPAAKIAMPLWGGSDSGLRAARAAAGRAQALIGTEAVCRPVITGSRNIEDSVAMVPCGEANTYNKQTWKGQLQSPLPALVAFNKNHHARRPWTTMPSGTRPGTPRPGETRLGATRPGETRLGATRPGETRPGATTSGTHMPSGTRTLENTERNPSAAHPAARIRIVDSNNQPLYVTGRGTLSGQPHALCWGGKTYSIAGWAGPWPVDDNWWENNPSRYARLQITISDEHGNTSAYLILSTGRQWRIEAAY